MKYFVFTYSERTPRNGHTVKTVKLWRITRNQLVIVGEMSDTFVDKHQLLMMLAEHYKALPKRWFARHQFGGFANSPWSLKNDGVATFTEL